MKIEEHFFDFAAEAGLTKHLGGVEATDELAHLCRIDEDSYVLGVGCGVGATPVYLAGTYGCRAMGVDIVPRVIERCEERARRERVVSRTEFRVGLYVGRQGANRVSVRPAETQALHKEARQ